MNTDSIFTAVEELREVAGDGPASRKVLDALFRHVHNLKANAATNGLNELAAAAHEFENVLHSMRTAPGNALLSDTIPADVWNSLRQDQKSTLAQSIAEGARLFLIEASFDVADFHGKFQQLEEALSKSGEVISRLPNAVPGKVTFKILYAQRGEVDSPNSGGKPPFLTCSILTTSLPSTANSPEAANDLLAIQGALEKLSAALINLPAASSEGVLQQAVRAGRAAAVVTGKEVDFEVRGEDLLLDKTYVDPLIHLVRNAVDHGIESSEERVKLGKAARGKISIAAVTRDAQTRITVSDDGRGIDPNLIDEIFRPGFSTASTISELSGRGVGLDAVKTAIEQAGGSITVTSEVGHGSTFVLFVPFRGF